MRNFLKFFLVFVLGIIACVGALVGAGFYAYKNVTLNTLNKNDTKIHSEEAALVSLNYLTVEDLVGEYKYLSSLGEELTLNTMIYRYGFVISEELKPMLTEDIRSLPLRQVLSENGIDMVTDQVYFGQFLGFEHIGEGDDAIWVDPDTGLEIDRLNANISSHTLADFFNGDIDVDEIINELVVADVLDLHSSAELPVYISDPVRGEVYVSDIAPIEVWYDSDNNPVGTMMNAVAGMSMDRLGTALDELTIAEFMRYVNYGGVLYSTHVKSSVHGDYILLTEAKGVAAELGSVSIYDITNDNLQPALMDVYVTTALGFTQIDGEWYDGTRKLTGVMAAIAKNGYTIGELNEKIGDMKLGELADLTLLEDGKWYKTVDSENPENNVLATGVLAVMADLTVDQMTDENSLSKKVKEVKVADALGYKEVDGVWYKLYYGPDDPANVKLSGFMAVVADTQVNDIEDTLNKALTGDLLGYTKAPIINADGEIIGIEDEWRGKDGKKVHVLMQKIADTPFEELGTLTDHLTLGDVVAPMDRKSGFISLVPADTLITDISPVVNRIFEEKTLIEFVNSGAITFKDTVDNNGNLVTGEQRKQDFIQNKQNCHNYTMYDVIELMLSLDNSLVPPK